MTSFHQGHLKPVRCNASQFRRPRRELDSFFLQNVVHSSAATTLGHPSRKHQDWFDDNDEEIVSLLEEKHLNKTHQDDTRA